MTSSLNPFSHMSRHLNPFNLTLEISIIHGLIEKRKKKEFGLGMECGSETPSPKIHLSLLQIRIGRRII